VSTRRDGAADKRRVILDAAITVFAREGFHRCRVSDIAREANVAYGLVYHYFRSKDEVLDTLFTERWSLLLEAISAADRSDLPVRDRLRAIADFIIESYRNDPDLMKVIIVEVTRAANTFGRAHLGEIRQAYDGISGIVAHGQEDGTFRSDISAEFATLCFYGAIEQLLTAWIFGELTRSDAEFEQAKHVIVETICDGLAVRSSVSAEL
jgi:TetR/AcrR family transcriptional regulator, fatty acid metabolism regulator protein